MNVNNIIKIIKSNNISSLKQLRENLEIDKLLLEYKKNNKTNYEKIKHEVYLNKLLLIEIKCRKIAKKCKTRKEFYSKYKRIYESAYNYDKNHKKGFLDEICLHMISLGNRYRRCIYKVYFPEINSLYVGLTCDYERRISQHKQDRKGILLKYINEGLSYSSAQITDYLNVEEAQEKEKYYINKYSKKYNIINKSKGGGLGGKRMITDKELYEKASLYDSYKELCEDKLFYYKIQKRGILLDIKKNIFGLSSDDRRDGTKNKGGVRKWTRAFIKKEIIKYNSYSELRKDRNIYSAIIKYKMRKEVKKYFGISDKEKIIWNKELILEEASRYDKYSDFRRECSRAYDAARSRKLLPQIKKEIFGIDS